MYQNNPSVSFADSSLYTREPSGVLMFPLLRVDGRRVRTAPHIRGAERSADVSPFTGSRSESENGYAYTGGSRSESADSSLYTKKPSVVLTASLTQKEP